MAYQEENYKSKKASQQEKFNKNTGTIAFFGK